jgi:signal transduction histidine kinase/ActR/RegA family two-component response regulator
MPVTAWHENAILCPRRVLLAAWRGVAAHGAVILGIASIALVWAGVLHSLAAERAQAFRGAVQDAANLSRAFEEHVVRSIKTIDQTLLYVRESYERDRTGFDLSAWARSTRALTDMTFQISLTDKNGILTVSDYLRNNERIDLSDREHFRVHRDNPGDDIFISKPVVGRASRKWSIQLSRKLMTAGGAFDGMVVVSLSPRYFSRFYESVDLGKQGIVMLAGADGVVRASAQAGGDDTALAQSLTGRVLTAYARSPAGAVEATSETDGVTRICAYRGVRGYPLVVGVGIGREEVLVAYRASEKSYLVLATLMTVLLLAVTVGIIAHNARLKRAREKLLASEAAYAQKSTLLQTTLEHMSQGILMLDASRRVQVCNRQTIETLGLPAALMAGSPLYDDVLLWLWQQGEFGEDGRDVEPWLRQFLLEGGVSDRPQAYERTRPDGMVLEIRSTPLPGGGVVRTFTDITSRKRIEAGLRAARDQADRAASARSEFLAVMSHEIRSPMSGLLGVLDLLRDTDLDSEQRRMANMVHSSASALLGVLNDILDFSKIEAGALSIVPEPTSLRDLTAGIVEPYRYAALDKDVDLTLRVSPKVPDYTETDPLRLRQILNNLLSNAVKFTRAGQIAASVEVARDGPAPRLRFVVRDTGIGMTADVIGRLFEPFVQADGSTTRNFGGTGLGLCISRRLARLMDGDLTVTSRLDQGSEFTLLLPLIPARAPEAGKVAAGAPARPARLRASGRVLVVDDEPTNRWLTQRQLERLGLTAQAAENGEAALATLRAGRYDLMVTDCHMPVMDGVALTCAVRAASDPALSALPIIGLTADVTAAQRERCLEAGMTDVAIKPLTLERLSRLVLRHLPSANPDMPAAPAAASPEPASALPFDDQVYRELFPEGDSEGKAWLGEFLDLAGGLSREVQALLAVEADATLQRKALSATAHRLAGCSLSAGAMRLGAAARALEQDATSKGLPALRLRHAVLEREFVAAKLAIAGFLTDVQPESIP